MVSRDSETHEFSFECGPEKKIPPKNSNPYSFYFVYIYIYKFLYGFVFTAFSGTKTKTGPDQPIAK